MGIVNRVLAGAPEDMDIRAWRARLLTWSGHLAEAEKEYLTILRVSRNDPDHWMGLAAVYLREEKIQDARRAIDAAEELDPKRADLHAARARILRAAGERDEARHEFQEALNLDPTDTEARTGLISVRGVPKYELRFGQDNDLLNFAGNYHHESASLISQWTPHWSTAAVEDFYQRGGADASKFVGSITASRTPWGALTAGGAIGHDNTVIPKSEAFFSLDRGAKLAETKPLRGLEFVYQQHWYWYQSARVLTLNGAAVLYLPQEWTFSLSLTGARSVFSSTRAQWRPSGITRLGFPLMRERRLSGNVFFAAGTENFAIVDEIGAFASQTYGGGLRFQVTTRQDVTAYSGYQKRAQNRTDTNFGLSYAFHF